MQVGSYDIHPGILVTIGMAIAIVLFFIALWRGNKKTGDAMRSIARDQGWAWIGPAPADLREALKKLYARYRLIPSNVIEVQGSNGRAYFFVVEQKRVGVASDQAGSATTNKGIACLSPGKAAPGAPILSIGRWPPGAFKTLVEMKANLREDVGSEAFRKRYYVEAPGYIGNPDKKETELTDVKVSRELERELLAWASPTGLLPDWSSIVIRGELVMATLMNRADELSADVWRVLLDKCQRVSQVLRDDRFG